MLCAMIKCQGTWIVLENEKKVHYKKSEQERERCESGRIVKMFMQVRTMVMAVVSRRALRAAAEVTVMVAAP